MERSLTEIWKGNSRRAKVAFVLALVAILILAGGAALWALRTDYRPLFTDLDPQDAAAIASELDRLKIPYAVGDDGASILVAKDSVHATRLKVMGKGLELKGTVGFEIFNNTDFGMTEFAQKVNYQRALQGELARTISALDEVRSARVHLVLPETGLLRRGGVRPKASVTLSVRGTRKLSGEQIEGIQRLVAASVPEMVPAAVTVLDQQGIALSRPADAARIGGVQLDAKREMEAYLVRKVVAVLDKALGPGRGIVSVDVDLDEDQVKVTREDILPGATSNGVVVRRRETTQRAASGDVEAGPVSGRRRASPPTAATEEIEYAHGRKVEQIVTNPGSVRRISVGVLLPADVDADRAEGLKRVIAMAVGLDPARGDGIAISWAGGSASPAVVPPMAAQARRPTAHIRSVTAADRAAARTSRSIDRVWRIPLTLSTAFPLLPAAAVVLLLLVLLVLRLRRAGTSHDKPVRALTPGEREETLARLKAWLASGEELHAGSRPR
jgi:flagellar M-ring protein FliF